MSVFDVFWGHSQDTFMDRLFRFHRKNVIRGSYPGSIKSAIGCVLPILLAHVLFQKDLTFGLGPFLQAHLLLQGTILSQGLASVVVWWSFCVLRKALLRRLLQYRGWLFEGNRPSIKTQAVLLSIRLLNGWILPISSSLYGLQGILPTLPIPSIQHSVKRYLQSMRPLVTEEKYRKMEFQGQEFLQKYSAQLQRYLTLKYWYSQNYVSDWWEEYVYLMGRSPLLVHSNYYCIDGIDDPTKNQAARAAMLAYDALKFREGIDTQKLKPLIGQGIIPLCSSQYERCFNTTRVPGESVDRIVHYEKSDHIVCYHHGKYFLVPIADENGQLLNLQQIQLQFLRILDDQSVPAPGEEKLAALTASGRTTWARNREAFFRSGVNRTSLEAIERSAFLINLDDEDQSTDIYQDDTSHLDKFSRIGLYGNGYNRWCDKSFSFGVSTNGRASLMGEHTWADAPILSQMCQLCMKGSLTYRSQLDENELISTPVDVLPPVPTRLQWDLQGDCLEAIDKAVASAKALIEDVDLRVLSHRPFGKGLMKKCRVSPDAFIQMALQLAYYRCQNKFDLTYEAAMTRFYKFGRTETVRSCTEESCRWVLSMEQPNVAREEKLALFKQAWEKHQDNYRHAMSGNSFDRHFFALFVVSKYLKIECDFLKDALSKPWRLSTSQTPTWNESVNDKPHITAGGGFGATCPDGYGVSYIIGGDHALIFHVTSFHSCPTTNSTRFTEEIARALDDIRQLHGVELDPIPYTNGTKKNT